MYTDPVDLKKLKFIFLAIEKYTMQQYKNWKDIEVLEVGCGKGGITLPLTLLGCHVRAFDINVNEVKYLKDKLAKKKLDNCVVTVDNGYTFYDGKTYDIVIASEVFEHVSEPSKLIENIKKRMYKSSYLILTIPNGYGPWEIKNRLNFLKIIKKWNWLRHNFGKQTYIKGNGDAHCQFYTRKNILELFSKHSFELLNFGKSDSFLTVFPHFRKTTFLGYIDIMIADALPYWMASGWYFIFQLESKD